MENKKFKVVDLYDGKETLGYADSLNEIKKIARKRLIETDGECQVFYYPLNDETGKYKFSERVFLKTC